MKESVVDKDKDSRGNAWIGWSEAVEVGMAVSTCIYDDRLAIHIDYGNEAGLEWVANDEVLSDPKKFERAKLAIIQSIEYWTSERKPAPLTMAAIEGLVDALQGWKIKRKGE